MMRFPPSLAALASALGLTACHAGGDGASPVSAREVAPTMDAAPAPVATGPSASTPPAPTTAPEEHAAADRSSPPSTAADAAAPAPGLAIAPLSFFVAQPLGPARRPSRATPAPTGQPWQTEPNVSCGAKICGAPATAPGGVVPTVDVKAPTATVDLGLGLRPGLSADDTNRAGKALAILRLRLGGCVNRALAADPTLVGHTMKLKLLAPGSGGAATIAVVCKLRLEQVAHAVPCFPTRSELWLKLVESYGL